MTGKDGFEIAYRHPVENPADFSACHTVGRERISYFSPSLRRPFIACVRGDIACFPDVQARELIHIKAWCMRRQDPADQMGMLDKSFSSDLTGLPQLEIKELAIVLL